MKKVLIFSAVGLAAYGLYLKYKKSKETQARKTLAGSFKKTTSPLNELMPDSILQNYKVDQRDIFAGGEYRNIPWPSDLTQNYVHS